MNAETPLTKSRWSGGSYIEEVVPGTEDWQLVVELGDYDYSWAIINGYYSPSTRRYFWLDDGGCSCTAWGDDVSSVADFESGSRDDLLRALGRFAEDNEWAVTEREVSEARAKVRTHRGAR